jgi:hypothetical protein
MVDAFRENLVRRSGRQAITLAHAVRAGRRRRKTSSPEALPADGTALRDLLREAGATAQLAPVAINRAQWTPTNLHVCAGEQVTWLAWGYAYVIKPLGIGVRPHFALAAHVDRGAVHQSGRDTYTFTADRNGPVELASLFPGELRTDGTIATDRIPYRVMSGSFGAVVARWSHRTDPRTALEAIADRDTSGLCAAEAKRLHDAPMPPPGWHHHPLLRPAETYTPTPRGIATQVQDGVGILQHPIDVPLTPTLRLRWSWRLDALPSRLPENTTLTHDYLSVALEFDDGQDLTWYWSSSLPTGLTYRCPFDHWRRRETHMVVRSGTADLGRSVDEERPVLADYQVAVGGRSPARIVGVWLISCSFLQGTQGRGEFSSIELVDGGTTHHVL